MSKEFREGMPEFVFFHKFTKEDGSIDYEVGFNGCDFPYIEDAEKMMKALKKVVIALRKMGNDAIRNRNIVNAKDRWNINSK